MSNFDFLAAAKAAGLETPEVGFRPKRGLEVILPELLKKNLGLSELYPESPSRFREAAIGIIAAVRATYKTGTVSFPTYGIPVSRLENGIRKARFYSPYFVLISSEISEAGGLILKGLAPEIPSYFFSGFAGIVYRYAVSSDGNTIPTDPTRNPKSRYNSKPGFAPAFGGDYIEVSRSYGEKGGVDGDAKAIIEKLRSSLAP